MSAARMDIKAERKKFEKRYKPWEIIRNRLGDYIVGSVQEAWTQWLKQEGAPPVKKRRKMCDRFDVEVRLPCLSGRDSMRWNIIKSFYTSDEAYQYEREFEGNPENSGTPVRLKARRVPVTEE